MFIINNAGRVVGLPPRMEESGFRQAKEVLSISSELMEGGSYVKYVAGGTLQSESGKNLKNRILNKFPNVVTDEEYLSKNPVRPEEEVEEKKEETEVKEVEKEPKKKLVNEDMTKKEIVITAKENEIELTATESYAKKDKLIKMINDRYQG